jgi:putative ABC transport system permease protein
MADLQTVQTDRDRRFTASSFGLWLSWRELNGRKTVFAINVAIIALLVALPVTLDLMGKARKRSVGTRIDYMGPSLSLVPRGISSSDLVTAQMKGRTFSRGLIETVRKDLSPLLRAAEARLITRLHVEGKTVPAVGIDFQEVHSYPFSEYSLLENEVLLGEVAARKLGRNSGDVIRIRSRDFTVAGTIPTAGGIEDVSMFLELRVLQKLTGQEGRINEIRLFSRSAEALEELKSSSKTYYTHVNIVDSYRGDVAEKDIDVTLQNYQRVVYAAAFILIALCIIISTYINLDGRKAEISTVYTLGARQGVILQVLAFRTVWIALLGSFAGHLLGILAMLVQDASVPMLQIWSWTSFLAVLAGTVALGLVVTMPFALYSVYKRALISYL